MRWRRLERAFGISDSTAAPGVEWTGSAWARSSVRVQAIPRPSLHQGTDPYGVALTFGACT